MRACLHRTLCTAGPHVFVSWSPCPTLHFPNEETDPTYRAAQGPAVENPGLAVPSHSVHRILSVHPKSCAYGSSRTYVTSLRHSANLSVITPFYREVTCLRPLGESGQSWNSRAGCGTRASRPSLLICIT